MEKYRSIAFQAYDTIKKEIDSEIGSNPKTREIKFVKDKIIPTYFNSYSLTGKNIPTVKCSDIIKTVPRKELADIVDNKLDEDSLPQEIRLIRTDKKKDLWSIYFKR